MEGDKEEKSTSRKLQDEREELHPDMFERDESAGFATHIPETINEIVDDPSSIQNIPCFLSSFQWGVIGGLGVGAVTTMFKVARGVRWQSAVHNFEKWALFSTFGLTIIEWNRCNYHLYKQELAAMELKIEKQKIEEERIRLENREKELAARLGITLTEDELADRREEEKARREEELESRREGES